MTTLLQINASIHNDNGQSSQLANQFVAAFRQSHPDANVVVRDVAASETVPHLTAERFGAFITQQEKRTAAQHSVVAYSDALIEEIKRADVVVIGLPMYNFGVPSQLKAYFDTSRARGSHLHTPRRGPWSPDGQEGIHIRRARGQYVGTPMDTQTGYVRDFLAFLGMTDVQFVYAEGLAISPQSKQAGLEKAAAEIARLAA